MRFSVVSGHEYTGPGGEIFFPGARVFHGEEEERRFFATNFGWNFAHNGVVYDKTDNNCRLAMRRLTCVREAERPFLDAWLRINQRRFIREHYQGVLEMVRDNLGDFEYDIDMRDAAEGLGNIPHPKLELRRTAIRELWNTGDVGETAWLRSVLWKFKTAETAKPGKYPRNIVDLGVSASLQLVPISDEAKHYFNSNVIIKNGCCLEIAIQPKPSEVTRQLKTLFDHPYRLYMVVYSDDACLSVNIDGTLRVFNLDIKSCDTSHTRELFHLLFDVCSFGEDFRKACLRQIMAPIRVVSIEDQSRAVLLRPRDLYLQSGIAITTLINDLAQFVIFFAFSTREITSTQDIIDAGEAVGYLLEVTPCEKLEDAQFLKMSLAMSDKGDYHATLNLGVILRCSGRSKYTIPGKGSYVERAVHFQHSLMSGCLHNIVNRELERLSPFPINRCDTSNLPESLKHLNLESTVHRYSFASLCNRYDLDSAEYEELLMYMNDVGFGSTVYCSALTKIFDKDYGLNCPLEGV